jgi:hypothetical protein
MKKFYGTSLTSSISRDSGNGFSSWNLNRRRIWLIAYLGFLKWELQIDSIFSDPKQTYRYHRFPHESNRSPHRVPFSEPKPYRPEPGERSGLNGPLIAQFKGPIIIPKIQKKGC